MTRLIARRLAAAAALALLAGCATSSSAAGLRARRLEAALDATPLQGPLDELWPRVRHLLAGRKLPLAGADGEAEGQEDHGPLLRLISRARETEPTGRGGRRLETGWGPRLERYLAEAIPDGAGWRVRLTAVREHPTEHGHDGDARRDAALELELVRLVDPALADVVLARADGPGAATPERPVAPQVP